MRVWERLAQLPPARSHIPLSALLRRAATADPGALLREVLAERLAARRVAFFASGREALRVALIAAAQATGRNEVLVPAYTCFSVPAACVAAGLRVRLVDVDERGRARWEELAGDAWSRAAACLLDNRFGLPEPAASPAARARDCGAWLVDDAAQSLGARASDGAVGARGNVGVLSFGRGKPLSGLGGGALVFRAEPPCELPGDPSPARVRAALKWLAYALASRRPTFGCLAAVPALGIGETVYDPGFTRGRIGGAALLLAAAALADFEASAARRRCRAHGIAESLSAAESDFEPLLEAPGSLGVFPRLALLAPDPGSRDRALSRLRFLGASAMYPAPLGAIRELRPHLVGGPACPGAAAFCARLLTVPTHDGVGPAQLQAIARALARP